MAPAGGSLEESLPSRAEGLDPSSRALFESRLGLDLGAVRIHTDRTAAHMARAVQARAFTVGRHVVFGAGEYAPGTPEGRRLIAHELVHTAQQATLQATGAAIVQRACLPSSVCSTPAATLENFVAETQADPVNVSKAAKRQNACNRTPPAPACTSDGHGAPATALRQLLSKHYSSRLSHISGIYVDKDMPAAWGAYQCECSRFVPPRPGTRCVFVPDVLEAQARQYRQGAARVGGQDRAAWLTNTLATLTHETEHARFDAAAPIADPSAACKFADHKHNLSELAAMLSEMHVHYRAALARPEAGRFSDFESRFPWWISNGYEDIRGIVQDLRCRCSCADADELIKKTAESVATSQGWNTNEASMIHGILQDPKWTMEDGVTPLRWPVAPPAAVDLQDLPTSKPVPATF